MNVTLNPKSKMIGWIALGIILGITLAVLAAIALQIDDWGRDWTQNTATLDANAVRADLRPVELDADAQETVDRIRRWVQSQPNWTVVSESDPFTIVLTRITPFLRFVDDITVTVSPNSSGQGVTVNAKSQSRIGRGDLGQNPRNLVELTNALKEP